jgi:subtilisin family serine protease
MLRQHSTRGAVLLGLALAMALASAGPGAWAQAAPKPRIEKAADLPRFTYKIDGKLEDVLRSPERFAPFAAAVRRDTEAVLAGYEITDKGARRDLISTLAALDFLDGRYDSTITRLDEVRALQDKPADKLLSGLRLRAMAQAARSHPVGSEAYRKAVGDAIRRDLAPMPYAVIENDIKGAKAGAELLGEALVLGRVREVWQPIVEANGALSSDFAPGVIGSRLMLLAVLPLKVTLVDTYGSYLAANKVEKPDIWAAREAVLPPNMSGRSVTVAVWDSGVETKLFPGQVLNGADGQPSVIAFDKYGRPASGELMPIPPALQSKLPQMTARTKGLSDLRSNIDSAEASQIKQLLSTMPPEQYRSTIEEFGLAGNYQHGTHVAGIALAGLPQARLVVGRIEFSHTLKPDPCPSREQAERDARAVQATIDHFKRQGVRVANLSWGGSVGDVAAELEQCGIGKTPDERKVLAREYFDIGKQALVQAFGSAPDILFVTAAGNSNADASFAESMPADIVAPNLLTVGAVDRAGDEASFTSYGPTVKVHANGFQVDSFLPGGQRVALSGTSMAAPQVANLAAKLLVVNPKLKPAELVDAIVKTAERSADGRRNLIHPKKALAAAQAGAV